MARFETHTVGSQFIVLPKGLEFTYPRRARGQLHRQAGRRQAQEAADRPLGPSATTRRSSAGPRSTSSACRRPSRNTTGSWPRPIPTSGRSGSTSCSSARSSPRSGSRKWAELLQVRTDPTRNVSQKAMFLYYNWLVDKLSKNMPMDQMVQELLGASGGTFKNAGDQLLPDHQRDAAADRERRPGLHGHPRPVRPVPQPPVRPLDAERLLQLRRVLRPDRPQAGRGLSRDDRLQLGRRRGEPPGRRPGDAAQVPGRRGPRRRAARTAASSWPSGWPRPRTPGSPPRSPTASGPTSWASGSSSRSTTSASATRRRTPSCSRPWASTSPTTKYNLKALVRDICNSRTYQRTTQRNESNAERRAELRPRPGPADQGREPARHDQRGDRHQGQVRRPAPRRPRRADRRRHALDLLPDDLRPGHPRDRLLVRGQDGADALAGPPPAQRRHGQRQDPARAA